MKKFYKYFIIALIVTGCNEDFTFKFQDKVAFKESEVAVDEGDIYSVEIQLVGAQRSTPIQVTFETSGTAINGQDYFVGGGTTVTIPANSSVGIIDVSPVDNSVIDGVEKTIILTITSVSEAISAGHGPGVDAEGNEFEEEFGKSITITIRDNDCPSDLAGVYDTLTTGCFGDGNGGCEPNFDFTGLTHVVTITQTQISDREYIFSDITGGLYLFGYTGGADNPVIVRDGCGILRLNSQRDIVRGFGEFNGSGEVRDDGSLVLNWSNSWGDQGKTIFTK